MKNIKKQCISCNEKKCEGCHTFSNWEPGKVQCWMCSQHLRDNKTIIMGVCEDSGKRIRDDRKVCKKFEAHTDMARETFPRAKCPVEIPDWL